MCNFFQHIPQFHRFFVYCLNNTASQYALFPIEFTPRAVYSQDMRPLTFSNTLTIDQNGWPSDFLEELLNWTEIPSYETNNTNSFSNSLIALSSAEVGRITAPNYVKNDRRKTLSGRHFEDEYFKNGPFFSLVNGHFFVRQICYEADKREALECR